MTDTTTYVEAGDTVNDEANVDWTILVPCTENGPGHWFCTTHHEHLANNMQKDGHVYDGTHRLAWFCHEHGYEAP